MREKTSVGLDFSSCCYNIGLNLILGNFAFLRMMTVLSKIMEVCSHNISIKKQKKSTAVEFYRITKAYYVTYIYLLFILWYRT